MTSDNTASLFKLSDLDQTFADPAEDIRGRTVRDAAGEEIGKVGDLLIDSEDHKVRFLVVEHGGFLGLGATPSFIPVDAVREVTEAEVRIGHPGQQVADAPRYDPEMVDQREFYGDVYGYYGYAPFWSAGYVYPGYPVIPSRYPP